MSRAPLPPYTGEVVGIRPVREGGLVQLDATMILAAVARGLDGQARTRVRWVVRKPDEVVAEVLEREPTEQRHRFVAWCRLCGEAELPGVEMPRPAECCNKPMRVSDLPAGWSWAGRVRWTIERAEKSGAIEDADAKGKALWRNHPESMLRNRVAWEVWKVYAPDALPVGARPLYPDEEDEERRPENQAHQGRPSIESRLVRVSTDETRSTWGPWEPLVAYPPDAARAALAGREPPRSGPRGGKRPLFVEVFSGEDAIDVYQGDHERSGWDVKIIDHRRGKPETPASVYDRLRVLAGRNGNTGPAGVASAAPRCVDGERVETSEGDGEGGAGTSAARNVDSRPAGTVPAGSYTQAEGPQRDLPNLAETGAPDRRRAQGFQAQESERGPTGPDSATPVAPPPAPTTRAEGPTGPQPGTCPAEPGPAPAPPPAPTHQATAPATQGAEETSWATSETSSEPGGPPPGSRTDATTASAAPATAPRAAPSCSERSSGPSAADGAAPAGEPRAAGGAPRVARNWLAPVLVWSAQSDEVLVWSAQSDEVARCILCNEDIEGGDRYQESGSTGHVAHVLCVEDVAAGLDPRAEADAPLVHPSPAAVALVAQAAGNVEARAARPAPKGLRRHRWDKQAGKCKACQLPWGKRDGVPCTLEGGAA